MRFLAASIAFVLTALLAVPPSSDAGSPGPDPREAPLHHCQANAGDCVANDNAPPPLVCSVSNDACPPLDVAAGPIPADLVLSLTDVPSCDDDPTVACGTDIQPCTSSAGAASSLDVLLQGRFHRRPAKHPGHGGKPFLIEESFVPCELGVHACNGDAILCSNQSARLTEASLVGTSSPTFVSGTDPRDLTFQPLPGSLVTALKRRLHIRSGTPYITDATRISADDQDHTGDAAASVVHFTVMIEFIR